VRFFGTLDICCDDESLPKPPTLKSQSLLAYLIHHRHQPQPRERLAGLFWGDRPEAKARHSLATALWHIRRCLPARPPGPSGGGDYFLSDSHTVQFDPLAEIWLDVAEFESGIARQDVTGLEVAAALYRGDFLDGFYDDWVLNERYRLETLYSATLARLMGAEEAGGEPEAALTTAQRLLQHDPVREDAHRVAMRAYCRLGQRNAALEQYHRCREVVGEELGAEPMVETTDLYHAILEGRFAVGGAVGVIPAVGVEGLTPMPPGRSPLDAIVPSRLVGREGELEFLQAYWQLAEGGQGGLVLIRGEAGVGKTRLAKELAGRLRWQGVRVLWGRCYEFERLLPYQPLSEALRTVLPGLTAAELADLAPWVVAEVTRLVPEMAERYPDLEVPDPTDATQEEARLFEGVACFLRQLSSHQALLVVVEDLHWASESTLQMLHYLARQMADQKVLLLGTLRPEAVGRRHPLRTLQRQLSREGLAQLLRLPRLSPQAVEALVVEMSGAGAAAASLAGRLYQETEGNPFFLMEIVKALFGAGTIYFEEGAWRGDFTGISEGELPLPTGMSEAIESRVRRLDDDAQEALRQAAVLGREFDFDLLDALWDRGIEATLEALDDLLRHRLVEEGSGAVGRDYAFSHHKIQEVVYAGLPRRRRQHAHARAGEAMERLYGVAEVEALAGELAHHFEQGRALGKALTEKAIHYLLQAGDRARGLYAHREAIDYYRRALALLQEQQDYERAARTLMRLGLTYHNAFDYRQARQVYEEGFGLWQQAASAVRAVPPPAPHALRMHWLDPATRVDPALADARGSIRLIQQLFSGLVVLSPEMEVLPDAARTWEVSEGGRRYVFHLRGDSAWSDGVPVTAHDFEYAWKRVLDPLTGSTIANLLYDIKGAQAFHQGELSDSSQVGVRALDKCTLAVELEGPTGYFLYLLANSVAYPVPRHVVAKHGGTWTEVGNIVTNGPFRLESWHPGEEMILRRYPAYHGRFGGNAQQVELKLLPVGETLAALEMYKADELDMLNLTRLSPAEMDQVRHGHPGEYVRVPGLSTCYVGFDTRRPPFDDVRVRQAFVQAAERETLADVVLKGYNLPATGGFVPPGVPGHSPGIGLPYDPDQARDLLAEAGFPGGRGFPTVEAMTLPGLLPHAEYLQARWRESLGIEISWQLVEGESWWGWLLSHPPQLLALGWFADYPDPDNFLRASTIPWCMGWGNETCESLVEEARRVTDQPQRMELYRQADRILVEEARILPLTYESSHRLVKPWVSRYPTSALATRFWKDIVIEPH
jgi:ABC-type oligopeptide transport system substrate-binding subunit/DNA-binding SARP family transcriptional activator